MDTHITQRTQHLQNGEKQLVPGTIVEEPHNSTKTSSKPFIYRLYTSRLDRLVWLLMVITVVPIKIILGVSLLVLSYMAARLSVVGLPLQPERPLSPWRVLFKDIATFFATSTCFVCGLARRTTKGVRASSKEATLLVVAPHTAFLDVMVGVMCGMPGVVSLIENASLPFLGALFRANQTIFLDKKDPQSRLKTAQAIRDRAESQGAWPQLLIYPEGMIGNGSALLPFKSGAFQPGVPIQPVTVKYPNKHDVTTWLDSGPSLGAMITLWLCTPITGIEVEYHPVYHPSEEEQSNPELFAKNVRDLMCRYLKIPKTDQGSKELKELVKITKPNMGVFNTWKEIITKGFIEMPSKEYFN